MLLERAGTSRCWPARSCATVRSRLGAGQGSRPTSCLGASWTTGWWSTGILSSHAGVDPEILGFAFVDAPHDLSEGEFLTGGEAWIRCREGHADPSTFGVDGVPENFGIGEIRGNLIRDLAALNKVETLPWDEWGRMEASYAGATDASYDDLMDLIAAACGSGDESAIAALYASHDLAFPAAGL